MRDRCSCNLALIFDLTSDDTTQDELCCQTVLAGTGGNFNYVNCQSKWLTINGTGMLMLNCVVAEYGGV